MAETTNRGYPLMADNEGDKPQAVNDLANAIDADVAQFGNPNWGDIQNVPSTFTPSSHAATHATGGADTISINASQITAGTVDLLRLPVSSTATADKIIVRDNNGRARVADPVDSSDIATKNFVLAHAAGGLDYQGTWNAATNTPAIVSGAGTNGQYYKVSTQGTTTIDGENDWNVNDWIIFNGQEWQKIDNSEEEATSSVHGRIRLAGNLSGDADAPLVKSLTFTSNLLLTLGSIADGQYLKRDGASLVGAAPTAAKYAETIGNGSDTLFTVVHSLGTKDLTSVLVYDTYGYSDIIEPQKISIVHSSQITVEFSSAPSLGQYRVVISA